MAQRGGLALTHPTTARCHTEHVRRDGDTDCTGHGFHHETLFYSGADGFLEGTLPFLNSALEAEEPVLVAVGNARIEALKETLGSDAEQVHFTDMRTLGGNPARIIPAWRQFLEDHASDGRLARGIGEPVWPGRSPAELTECQRHESLLNLAFDAGQAWRLLCPYDIDALDEEVIEAARRSHPFVTQNGASHRSEVYRPPHEAPGPFAGMLCAPSAQPVELAFTGEELGTVRRLVAQTAKAASLNPVRTDDLVLAVNELATNSVRHGGGRGTLRMWTEADELLCEVHDAGHIDEPLVGRLRPGTHQRTGRGLWMVNHLCDLVQIRSSCTGNVVRVHMYMA
jgi:anti-sigma regulatory factor (Ser/Thr protein kinase)